MIFLELAEVEYSFRVLCDSFICNIIDSMSYTRFLEIAELEYLFRVFCVSFIYIVIDSIAIYEFSYMRCGGYANLYAAMRNLGRSQSANAMW